jgi:hypothetical protein
MAFDKFEYHFSAADFPPGVPARNGGTHIGMFIDWARECALPSEQLHVFSPIGAWLLRHRMISGRTFASVFCDRSFSSGDHLNGAGHAFADAYYDRYLEDYRALFDDRYKKIYHVPYTRLNRRRISELLDRKYSAWTAEQGQTAAG